MANRLEVKITMIQGKTAHKKFDLPEAEGWEETVETITNGIKDGLILSVMMRVRGKNE